MTASPLTVNTAIKRKVPLDAPTSYSDVVRRWLLVIFLLAMVLPIQPRIAELRMDPYRFFLLVLFVPFVISILRHRAGQVTLVDVMMGCYGLWIVVTLVFHHGMARFAYAAILAMMLFGGYMVGRLLIRNAQDYIRFIRYFIRLLFILLPFAIYEFLTERMIIADTLGGFFPVIGKFYETRHGLSRVQVFLPHSILFGLFCSMAFANVIYIYRQQFLGRLLRLALVLGMTTMALSSAPLLSIGLQGIMAGWDKVTRGRWMLLFSGVTAIYIFLSLASDRGPILLIIDKLTFNPATAWWRVHIWNYGTQNVMANPFFGLGLNDWARPEWLADTVDNFWLLTAMQAGLPALIFVATALIVHVYRIVRVKGLNGQVRDIRTGYLVVLAGTVFTLSTVHVWDAMAMFIMFYIGAGAFLYTSRPETLTGAAQDGLPPQNGAARAPAVYARSLLAEPHKRRRAETISRKTEPAYVRDATGDQNPMIRPGRIAKKDII